MSAASEKDLFDPLSTEFAASPYQFYAALREHPGLHFHRTLGTHLIARFVDVDAVARSPSMVRTRDFFVSADELAEEKASAQAAMPNHFRYVQFSLLDSDGAVHRRLRRLLLGQFSKQAVQRYKPVIDAHLSDALNACLEKREFDFVSDLASHVPGWIIGHVLGVPPADRTQLKGWSQNIVQFFDTGRTEVHAKLAETNTAEFAAYLRELIRSREQHPRDDLLTTLVGAKRAGELNETELISTCMLILMAGHGSTIDALGTGMYALLCHPHELVQLRKNPTLMPSAVQEMFRYESPLPYFHRYAAAPVEIGGHRYETGTKFGLLYGAANRDPEVFTEADTFQIHRQPNRHLAFGRGAHLCLGNNLSRLDMEVFFSLLLERTAQIESQDLEPSYKRGITERGLQRLAIAVQPR